MCKNSDRVALKIVSFSLVFLLIISLLFPGMYMGAYKLINHVDPSIYARYATNQKFDENIFFKAEVEEKTGIIEQLQTEIPDLATVSRIQEFASVILQNQSKVERILANNEKYQDYLKNAGSSVEDLIDWSKKTAALDDKIIMGCLYLTFLIISAIMVILFGFRTAFYIGAGIVYGISILSAFSDGISDYLVANVFAFIAKLSSDIFTYQDMNQFNIIFSQAFKESTLTFIIFDTVVQTFQSNKKTHLEKSCRYIYSSMEIQRSYLEQFQNFSDPDYAYIAKMKLPTAAVENLCSKEIKSCTKKLHRKFLSDTQKNSFRIRCNDHEQLKENLRVIRSNTQPRTTKEYISLLRQIQLLMYKCNIVS